MAANNNQCVICQEPLAPDFATPPCGHSFCYGCLAKDACLRFAPPRTFAECPVCRAHWTSVTAYRGPQTFDAIRRRGLTLTRSPSRENPIVVTDTDRVPDAMLGPSAVIEAYGSTRLPSGTKVRLSVLVPSAPASATGNPVQPPKVSRRTSAASARQSVLQPSAAGSATGSRRRQSLGAKPNIPGLRARTRKMARTRKRARTTMSGARGVTAVNTGLVMEYDAQVSASYASRTRKSQSLTAEVCQRSKPNIPSLRTSTKKMTTMTTTPPVLGVAIANTGPAIYASKDEEEPEPDRGDVEENEAKDPEPEYGDTVEEGECYREEEGREGPFRSVLAASASSLRLGSRHIRSGRRSTVAPDIGRRQQLRVRPVWNEDHVGAIDERCDETDKALEALRKRVEKMENDQAVAAARQMETRSSRGVDDSSSPPVRGNGDGKASPSDKMRGATDGSLASPNESTSSASDVTADLGKTKVWKADKLRIFEDIKNCSSSRKDQDASEVKASLEKFRITRASQGSEVCLRLVTDRSEHDATRHLLGAPWDVKGVVAFQVVRKRWWVEDVIPALFVPDCPELVLQALELCRKKQPSKRRVYGNWMERARDDGDLRVHADDVLSAILTTDGARRALLEEKFNQFWGIDFIRYSRLDRDWYHQHVYQQKTMQNISVDVIERLHRIFDKNSNKADG
ncbi:hypothetical protein FN846DRAFT_993877 [Sphaerosporella brunnea]|uniref:RING-type domain-containing protein n=1 Tax=Sphaerosporella brunnea TaxID=1250544 RepID=A0A5J5EMB4_9PEZI|nr:hypothetical protein FN846DRAFT_993877 [Sphaerosporella brunnea]